MKKKANVRSEGQPAASNDPWQAIAAHFAVDIRTVTRWRKLEGAPGSAELAAWEEFASERGLRKNTADLGAEKLRGVQLDNEKKELVNAQLRGESIAAEKVQEFLAAWSTRLDMILTMKLETEAPAKCVGKSVGEIRDVMREVHDAIRLATEKGFLKWKPTN